MTAGSRSSGLRPSRRSAAASVPPNQRSKMPPIPKKNACQSRSASLTATKLRMNSLLSSAVGGSGTIRNAIAEASTKPIPLPAASRSHPGTEWIVLEIVSCGRAAAD